MEQIDLSRLSHKFSPDDIEWRIGRAGKTGDKFWATCLAYVTNRAIMERLDSVCGHAGWKNEFAEWKVGNDHGVRCGISVKIDGEWVTKYDGAQPSNMEPIKGAFSDSMKRAAVQWGIGRYLYDLDEGFAKIVEKGASGAKYGTLPKDKGGDSFYWTPPVLPAWAVPESIAPSTFEPPVTPATLEKFNELLSLTDSDTPKFWAWINCTRENLSERRAKDAIAIMTKKLESSPSA